MAAASNDKKKVMDVAKPGKSAPSATTRPLIVSHNGTIIDPTVNDDVKSAPVPSADALNGKSGITITKPRGPKILQPLSVTKPEEGTPEKPIESESKMPVLPIEEVSETSESAEESASEEEKESTNQDVVQSDASEEESSAVSVDEPNETTDEVAAETAKDEPTTDSEAESSDTQDKAETSEDTKDGSDNDSESAAIVDAVVDQANIGKKQKEEDKELLARKELVNKLVDEKKYFIPIKQKNTTRSGRMTIVLSVLAVLAVLGGYAAVDVGMINPGFDVPFHLLKKKEVTASVTTPAAVPVTTTPPPAQSTTPQTTPTTLTYDSKELGITFTYPSAWGDVAVKKDAGATAGTTVSFTFSKQPMMRAGMLSKDYKAPGKDAVCFALVGLIPATTLSSIKSQYADGDSTYNTATYKTTTKFLKNTTDTLVYERFEAGQPDGIGGCSGISVAGYRSFATGSYTGIEFLWANPNIAKITPVDEFAKYKSSPNTYLSENDRKDVLAVIDSVKSQ